jgi:hypothetical protein
VTGENATGADQATLFSFYEREVLPRLREF